MAPTAADVPGKFDVLINGQGYVIYDPWTGGAASNAPEKSTYAYTPTFVPRSNTQNDYGDNSQDFWMTFSQKDWSLGEGQKYQGRTEDDVRKFWVGSKADIAVPGNVKIQNDSTTFTPAGEITAMCGGKNVVWFTTSTNLYSVAGTAAAPTDYGAHALGASPAYMITDSDNIYMSGGANIRKYDLTTSIFSNFSATPVDGPLVYLNNTLFGYDSGGTLASWNTGGTYTPLFTWKDADGGAFSMTGYLSPFGGKLLIMLFGDESFPPTLWVYDGTGVSKLLDFPNNFYPGFGKSILAVNNGIVFISGFLVDNSSSTVYFEPVVYYYANGALGLLWRANALTSDNYATCVAYKSGLLFTDSENDTLLFYDIGSGAINTVSSFSGSVISELAVATSHSFVAGDFTSGATDFLWPKQAAKASSATVSSSLIDFGSSLNKLFRGIKVDFDSATDGNNGSVDIAYRLADVDGSYTTLQTGAVSGTEYILTGISGRSLSIKVTINKGTSTSGPVLKHLSVRAAPILPPFRRRRFILDCTGRGDFGYETKYIQLRDGSTHNLDGLQMATNLNTAAVSGAPISITDKFGTFTGIIENDNFLLEEIKQDEFVAEVTVREV